MSEEDGPTDQNPLNMTIVEVESEEEQGSSDEFNFNDVIVCKKNLSVTFEQQHVINDVKINCVTLVSQQIAKLEQSIIATATTTSATATTGIVPSSQKLAVSLRIRPAQDSTTSCNASTVTGTGTNTGTGTVEVLSTTSVRTYPPPESQTAKSSRGETAGVKQFDFYNIFGPEASQETVYAQLAAPLLQGLLHTSSPSALLFSYGITNAGKTYTMMGNIHDSQKWGILPRAMEQMCQVPDSTLHLSYLEIYNEQIFDLLPTTTVKGIGTARMVPLKITGACAVSGLSKHSIPSVQAGLELVQQATLKRHTSSNNLNTHSSRSHAICQLELVINGTAGKKKTFWLVDLAGSERNKRTCSAIHSIRHREATLINGSLMTLMRCLLPESDIIPFRESKLTHLFMHHFISGGKTSMMVNVNPAPEDFDETQHVLSYAVAAKSVDVPMEEFIKKRKAMGLETHGLDGRSLKRAAMETTNGPASKISKLLRHLSPKQPLTRIGTKRKVEQDTMKSFRPKMDSVQQQTVNKNNIEKQNQLLKAQLSIAKAETEVLKNENQQLQSEIQDIESLVRMEAAEEMQIQLQAMREEYDSMYFKLQSKTQAPLSRSTKKAQLDKAQGMIDDLIEKVEECEEEMKRMREEHSMELTSIKEQHDRVVMMMTSELQILTAANVSLDEPVNDVEQTKVIERKEPSVIEEPVVESKRQPFGNLDNSNGNDVFFPKKPAALDSSKGIYKRPSGRAPVGRDWDERKGGWRLSSFVSKNVEIVGTTDSS